jgi:uncharacterized protein
MTGPAEVAAALGRALAARGVDAGATRTLAFAAALAATRPRSLADLYWTARVSMLPAIEDLAAFNAAFFSEWMMVADPELLRKLAQSVQSAPAPQRARALRLTAPPPSDEIIEDDAGVDAAVHVAMASPQERLAERDFAELDEHERRAALALVARLRVGVETRLSRRRWPRERGDRLDLRATLRSAARTFGELVRRRRSLRRERIRPLVFLCDVSGSMMPYARALIHYARANALARPRVRAFTFATRLTDIGPALVRQDAVAARALRDAVRDFGGGTRIGAALHAFNDGYAQRGIARGGTVVILSDGWERDDPELVRTEMARLQRLTRRIVWVNPQKKHPAFEPLTRGMAAALPFIDALVAGHNLRTLDAVADAVSAANRSRA